MWQPRFGNLLQSPTRAGAARGVARWTEPTSGSCPKKTGAPARVGRGSSRIPQKEPFSTALRTRGAGTTSGGVSALGVLASEDVPDGVVVHGTERGGTDLGRRRVARVR